MPNLAYPVKHRRRVRVVERGIHRGSAMIEFAVIGPVLTLIGLVVLQYGLMFFAKNQISHASFMAARAGSVGNAKLSTIRAAYVRALVPLYGGGTDTAELADSYAAAESDVESNAQIQILNPSRESFDDWSDDALTRQNGPRTIPNSGLAVKSATEIKSNSGQNIQDANLIKLRITHGYKPQIPLVDMIYTTYLRWLDPHTDAFHTKLVESKRIPIVTNVTVQMQSDAIEDSNASSPGRGNHGHPVDPGDPPTVDTDPPNCQTAGCTVMSMPVTPIPGNSGPGSSGAGNSAPGDHGSGESGPGDQDPGGSSPGDTGHGTGTPCAAWFGDAIGKRLA